MKVSFGTFYYDSGKIDKTEVPNTYQDLLDAKWTGKLILTYPNDDDAITYLFSIITARYGFAWLERLAEQDVEWVRGTATPFIMMSEGTTNTSSQRALSFTTTHLDGFSSRILSKNPIQEESMSWYQNIAIFKSTRCPESAKLFIAWLFSDEYQTPISNTTNTVLNHLNVLSGKEVYSNNFTSVEGFRTFMMDRATVEWWRFQLESTLGTAAGPDPNLLY